MTALSGGRPSERQPSADAGPRSSARWRRVTLADLARRARVSPITASRALAGTTDRMASGLIHGLLARGVSVPEDVAVVGYDDIAYAASAQVPLTTVGMPMRRLGEVAAEILFDRFDRVGPAGARQVLLAPQLVVRASCP